MKSYTQFAENAERAQQLRQMQLDRAKKLKKEGEASVQKTNDDNERRQMNIKRAKLRAKMKARGIDDDDGLLDDEED